MITIIWYTLVNMSENEYYTIKQFAEKLGVHPNTVRRAIKSGRIAAFRVGSGQKASFRIPHNEISRIALFDLKEMIENIIKERDASICAETA